jgi:hypothetical protein
MQWRAGFQSSFEVNTRLGKLSSYQQFEEEIVSDLEQVCTNFPPKFKSHVKILVARRVI